MTTKRDSFLNEIQEIRGELGRLLDGMDYCFDWKPSEDAWSARELLYHIVDTPSGGVHAAVQGVLEGRIKELPVTASLSNITPERQTREFTAAKEDLEAVLSGAETSVAAASDSVLTETKFTLDSKTSSRSREMTVEELIAGLFIRHWREHLVQLAALREELGLG